MKKILLLILVLFGGVVATSIVIFDFNTDSGESDTIEVSTWGDLHTIRENPDSSYVLVTDLDTSTQGYDEYGSDWKPISKFSGDLDGQGHTITGLQLDLHSQSDTETQDGTQPVSRVQSTEYNGTALILYNIGTIQNLSLTDIQVSGDSKTASLVVQNRGQIENVTVSGSIEGTQFVGGVVANNEGQISTTASTVSITADSYVGGLVGVNDGGEISISYYNSDLEAERIGGGITGSHLDGSISQTYTTGSITGQENIGGVVGATTQQNTISTSYHDIQSSNNYGTKLSTTAMQGTENKLTGFNLDQWQFNKNNYPTFSE